MSKKIEKILENKQVDEREIYENGKIYKDGLEKLLIITNAVYFITMFIPLNLMFSDVWNGKVVTLFMLNRNIFMFIINLTGFICITKSIKKRVFGGNIKKTTYSVSQFFMFNIVSIIMDVASLIGVDEVTRGIITLIAIGLIFPTILIYDYIIYKKYLKYNN